MDAGHRESLELQELDLNDLESQVPAHRRTISVRRIWNRGVRTFTVVINSSLLTQSSRIRVQDIPNVATQQPAHGQHLQRGEALHLR